MEDQPDIRKQLRYARRYYQPRIKRFPVGKQVAFKFPIQAKEIQQIKPISRKVKLINKADLRKLPTDVSKPFIGTLRIF